MSEAVLDRTPATGTFRLPRPTLGGWELPALVIVGLVGLWELLARAVIADPLVVPAPSQILNQLWQDRDLYPRNVAATLSAAAKGFVLGNVVAIVVALVISEMGAFARPALRVVVAFYCLPIIAIGPLLQAMLSGDAPRVALAALSVFFPTLLGTLVGLRSADPRSLDIIRAAGGGRWTALRKVRIRAALPGLFAGLCIAAPAALLGAVVGEFLGADAGLGVLMVVSLSSIETARAWGVALVCAVLTGGAFALVGAIGRRCTGWAAAVDLTFDVPSGPTSGQRWRRWTLGALTMVGSIVIILGLWELALRLLDVPPFVARGPADVWEHFVTAPDAAANRRVVAEALWVTTRHALLGLLVGTATAVGLAALLGMSATVRRIVYPMLIALQSVPIVALTPLLVLALGRGLLTTILLAALVSFFPTLVNLLASFSRTSATHTDLVLAYGGGPLTLMAKVQLPTALPVLFASLRVAAPAALLGVIVAEWLVTGGGVGSLMVGGALTGRFDAAWAAGVAVTVLSVVLYGLVGLLERPVLSKFGPVTKEG